ncbi:MAG: septum formation initiator family protein [Treponema sp.]|jgi:cell division protein FtsB|nr:septum formation initiator family protein [Treponema sp.]
MNAGKYLLVPWLMLAVYTLLSVLNGPGGIDPYRNLLREREKILENLDRLQNINRELEGAMDALLYDPETIRVKARELGYGEPGERFVRIVGLPGARQGELKPGAIRTAAPPSHASPGVYRFIACCAGLLLLGFFLFWDVRAKERAPFHSGAPKTIYP